MTRIIIGARNSKLSKAQVKEVLLELRKSHPKIEFDSIYAETPGDRDQNRSLKEMDKTDFFTRDIDQMVLSGKCRIAIHSAKDLPEPLPKGLKFFALTQGVDPSDSLVLRAGDTIDALPFGSVIGTSSVRREKMIKQLRPDFVCQEIRGRVDERLQKLDRGDVDGLVVAEAAMIRLGLTHRARIRLEGETAPLQGRLAIVGREGDTEMEKLFDEDTLYRT